MCNNYQKRKYLFLTNYITYIVAAEGSSHKLNSLARLNRYTHLMDVVPCSVCRSPDGETPLQHAITRHLPVVVDVLCTKGADMNVVNPTGNCPLWQALDTGQEDIAQCLVGALHFSSSHY